MATSKIGTVSEATAELQSGHNTLSGQGGGPPQYRIDKSRARQTTTTIGDIIAVQPSLTVYIRDIPKGAMFKDVSLAWKTSIERNP